MRIALGLEYDGRRYSGWQSQPGGRTLQDVLEHAIGKIACEPVRTICAGRTDAGVHALCQVVHFDVSACRSERAWVRGVNAHLPGDISVRWAIAVADGFHARFCATARRYRYLLLNRRERPGLHHGKLGWCHQSLDDALMRTAAASLIGEHDFSAFRSAECQAKSPVRHLRECRITRQGDILCFDFEANAYLHHMIRNLVGSLVYVGMGRKPTDWMSSLLVARDRSLAAPTFMPDGLYLAGVEYPPEWGLPQKESIITALPL